MAMQKLSHVKALVFLLSVVICDAGQNCFAYTVSLKTLGLTFAAELYSKTQNNVLLNNAL